MSLDLRTGKPVWSINKPRIARHSKLKKNIRSEVVVIGGGISGALIAHKLTNLGMQVTIIDSRKIGAGSTAAGGQPAALIDGPHAIDAIDTVLATFPPTLQHRAIRDLDPLVSPGNLVALASAAPCWSWLLRSGSAHDFSW